MALFRYHDTVLEFEPGRGYRNVRTGEWESSPVDAVSRYVEESPGEREDWVTLVRRIQDFWAAHALQGIPEFEEVRFEV